MSDIFLLIFLKKKNSIKEVFIIIINNFLYQYVAIYKSLA